MPEALSNERIKQLLRDLWDGISERASAERRLESDYESGTQAIDAKFQQAIASAESRFSTDLASVETEYEVSRNDALARCQNEHDAVESEYRALVRDVENQHETQTHAAQREQEEARWMVSSVLGDDSDETPLEKLKDQLSSTQKRLEAKRADVDAAYQNCIELLQDRRQWHEFDELPPAIRPSGRSESQDAFDAALETASEKIREIENQQLSRLFVGWRPLILFLLLTGPAFALIYFQVDPSLLMNVSDSGDNLFWGLVAGGIASVAGMLMVATLQGVARTRSGRLFLEVQQAVADLRFAQKCRASFSKQELQQQQKELKARHAAMVQQRENAQAKINATASRKLAESLRRKQSALAAAEAKYPARLKQNADQRDRELADLDTSHQQKIEGISRRRAEEIGKLETEQQRSRTLRQTNEGRERQAVADNWRATISGFQKNADEVNARCRQLNPDWQSILHQQWTLPDRIPPAIQIGSYEVNLEQLADGLPRDGRMQTEQTQFELPAVLPFPEHASLLFKCRGQGRAVAVDTMRAVMLRLLTSLPAGKVRFTIIDPVGLGENFSAFMHLADYDELMIGTRIWTETAHIEKRLADLTEHMENVFQAYLRNEFASIEEYNRQAGEVAEPYHILVVANLPVNFSEVAARRLLSIATSGSHCGVYTLISVDTSQPMPHGFEWADLEANATTLQWKNDRFVCDDPAWSALPLALAVPPVPEIFGDVVRNVGRQSQNARRVEVPFERIAPRKGELWKLDSRSGLDVPLGRAGATKLQHLRLGKGTSQHVLVAGKTGSGKSSFLHALITNVALHYSPNEVEFYLIDFKKGVEFKTYATHALPHARVIGIESDREFGVSVLERLDGALKERGELFRRNDVQDLESFRTAQPSQRLPRILLIVDEFQEFFVEDDHLSQTATLLLDRLVRQGRAFGIHVLLGSQTLGGAYTLARSTLGQVAVRIALQCSEADAHLILSEENTAARLLTRPGEAIYNDANGLLEGNHPFQVAWLPDDRRESYLLQVRERARDENLVCEPPIVFEGNVPSDPARNPALTELIETFHSGSSSTGELAKSARCVWLGEAVSIKAPTKVVFHNRAGDNLLVVGQDADAARGLLSTSLVTLAAQQKPTEPRSGVSPAGGDRDSSLDRQAAGTPADASQPCGQAADSEIALFSFLDGDAVTADESTFWQQTIKALPHKSRLVGQREAAAAVAAVAAEVARRRNQDGGDESPIFLLISNLGRFRELRKDDDDFGFASMDDGKPPSADKLLATILRDGPSVGVHSIIWCDTYGNASRWLSVQTLREFELRVAFQMNGTDSSNLIESPAASKLGVHRALLYQAEDGKSEKFRPYGTPSGQWLQWMTDRFRADEPADEICDDIDMWTVT